MKSIKHVALGLAALLMGGCGGAPGSTAAKAVDGWTPLWADAASAQLRPGSRISLGSSGCTGRLPVRGPGHHHLLHGHRRALLKLR